MEDLSRLERRPLGRYVFITVMLLFISVAAIPQCGFEGKIAGEAGHLQEFDADRVRKCIPIS